MIRIERNIMSNEIGARRFDNLVKDIMAERGYTAGHTGEENGKRFLEFDAESVMQEHRDYTNTIIAETLAIRAPGVMWYVLYLSISKPRLMLCPLCKGSGSLITFKPLTWWDCGVCLGQGVLWTGLVGPIIRIGGIQRNKSP
jgi:hypothetical protein